MSRQMEARAINQGDVFWVSPEALRPAVEGHAHPHVILQADVFNHSRIPTVVVCALSTNMKRATEPGNVVLDEGEANLPKQSVAVVSQISTVEKDQLGAYVGRLTEERVQQLLDGLTFQQRSFFDR
uniref:type II toxin-antitoxin system PemK/MazF family toxin n=1 Tax=Sphingomonas bacterium TaxID=1895847 RepID=UPI00262A7BE5|nr:type II toxin-antitoxin system PemK/MazF family toxin [Sphingomonas bacterium]